MTIDPSFIGPRDESSITILVTPTMGDPIVAAWLRLQTDEGRDSVALPFSGDEPQQAAANVTAPNAPVSATLVLTAWARTKAGLVDSATGVLTIGDTTPPTVQWTYIDDTVVAGQTADVGATYHDRSGLARYELQLTGALTNDEVSTETDFPVDGAVAFQVSVPEEPGDSIVQTATATDMYGLRTTIRQVYHIKSP